MDFEQGLDDKSSPLQSDAMESKPSQKKSMAMDLRSVKSEFDQVTTQFSEFEHVFHDKLDAQLGKSGKTERMARNLFFMQAAVGVTSLAVAIVLSVWVANNPNSSKDLGARGLPELIYLNAKGRAEILRIAFAAGSVRYKEPKGAEPDDQAVNVSPEIRHGVFHVTGTAACAEYVGNLGLNDRIYPSAQQRALDSEMLKAYNELMDLLFVDPNGDEGAAAGEKMCEKLTAVEALYQETRDQATGVKAEELERRKSNPEGLEEWLQAERAKHLTGTKGTYLYTNEIPSLGDLAIFTVLTMGAPACYAPQSHSCFDMEKWPRLNKMMKAIQGRALLKPYFAKSRKRWEQASSAE